MNRTSHSSALAIQVVDVAEPATESACALFVEFPQQIDQTRMPLGASVGL